MPPGKAKQQSAGHAESTTAAKSSAKKLAVNAAPKRARKSLALDPTLLQSSGSSDDNDEAEQISSSLRDVRGKVASISRSAGATVAAGGKSAVSQPNDKDDRSGISRQRDSPNRRSNRLSGEMSRDSQASDSRPGKQPAFQKRKTTQQDTNIGVRLTPPDSDAGETEHDQQTRTASAARAGWKPAAKKVKAAKQPISKPAPPALASDSDSSDNFAFTRIDPPSSQIPTAQQGSQQATTSGLPAPAKPVAGVKRKLASARAQPTTFADDQVFNAADVAAMQQPSGGRNARKLPDSIVDDVPPQDRKGKRKADVTAEASQPKANVKAKKGRTGRAGDDKPGTPTTSQVDVYTQETPAIQRNLEMRAGLPPGTPGSLARRSSADMRGRRGSSIGNGFEALPHPSLPSDTLYRHIRTDDPPVIRFRTLVTWAAHRVKDRLMEAGVNSSKNTREKAMRALDGMISDIVEKRADLNWTSMDADSLAGLGKNSEAHLPPNPQNEANSARLRSCQAWTGRLKAEDEARNARINAYKSMTERITRLTTVLPPASATNDEGTLIEMPDLLQPNWHLPIPRIRNKEEALAYGRKMLEERRSKRKSGVVDTTDPEPDVIDVEQELGIDLGGIAHDAAEIHQMAYRIDRYLKLSDTFLHTHLAKSHLALTQLTRPSLTAATSRGAASTMNLSDFLNGSSQSGGEMRAVNHRSLLRAIAQADMAANTTNSKKR